MKLRQSTFLTEAQLRTPIPLSNTAVVFKNMWRQIRRSKAKYCVQEIAGMKSWKFNNSPKEYSAIKILKIQAKQWKAYLKGWPVQFASFGIQCAICLENYTLSRFRMHTGYERHDRQAGQSPTTERSRTITVLQHHFWLRGLTFMYHLLFFDM